MFLWKRVPHGLLASKFRSAREAPIIFPSPPASWVDSGNNKSTRNGRVSVRNIPHSGFPGWRWQQVRFLLSGLLSDGCGETKVVLLRPEVAWVSVIAPTWHRRTFPSTLQWARRRRRCIDRLVKCTQSASWMVKAASPGMAQWRSWGNQDRPPATNKILTGKFGCCLSPQMRRRFSSTSSFLWARDIEECIFLSWIFG